MNSIDRLLPHPLGVHPGSRLRVTCSDKVAPWEGELIIILSDEDVLPEQVSNPFARNVRVVGQVELTPISARWLRDVMVELCQHMDKFGIKE